jgi:hypothetical protein
MDGWLLLHLFVSCHFQLVTHVGRIFTNLPFKFCLYFQFGVDLKHFINTLPYYCDTYFQLVADMGGLIPFAFVMDVYFQ